MDQPLPSHVTDTHVHVFDPRLPYATARSYTPAPALLSDLKRFHAGLGVERCVVVQPSVYGTDNTAVLDAVASIGREHARAVAVIDDATTDSALRDLADHGVVGLRLNVAADPTRRASLREPLTRLLERAQSVGVFVQVFAAADRLVEVADLLAASPVPVVLDHCGGIELTEAGLTGVDDVVGLLAHRHVWVKLSGAYRAGHGDPKLAQLGAAITRFVDAAPDRLVWGSDWPHTGGGKDRAARASDAVEPFRTIDDAADLTALADLLGTEDAVRAVLVDNPGVLCRFTD